MDEKLKLTKEQQAAWQKLQDALTECMATNCSIVLDRDLWIHPINGKAVKDYYYADDCDMEDNIVEVEVDELPSYSWAPFYLGAYDTSFGVVFKKSKAK